SAGGRIDVPELPRHRRGRKQSSRPERRGLLRSVSRSGGRLGSQGQARRDRERSGEDGGGGGTRDDRSAQDGRARGELPHVPRQGCEQASVLPVEREAV